ncbi:hypothetical protein N0V93_006732 [Gnomoniopsis smithogilvyi]|uniref:PH domain-containing protein n=1 Tax=Gnomoniopsis smithogilvyi TaxID=1191159 RepID=A0A9W8YQ92_9PEZI|nr:hypothetical protein N0V93_006732 [Gnomoniopsis smithogilvyi]
MATGFRKDSRYRALRGKSVSEHHKELEQALGGDHIENSSLSPTRDLTPNWRKRSKTQEHMAAAGASTDDLHSPLLSVPPVPHPQKEHTNTTRPKAAVIPSRPEFGRSISPAPLGKRKSAQVTETATPSVVDDVAFSDKIATSGDDDIQAQELQTVPERDGEKEYDEQPVDQEQVIHQHSRRDPSPLARSEAETDRMLAEQKHLLHQQLMSTGMASESMHSLASTSTFTFSTRTPTKTPVLGKLGFFSRGRSSRATFSPASSTIASMDSDRTQSTEPLISAGAYMAFNQQLLTPPLSPISPSRDARMSQVCVRYQGEWANIPISDTTDTVDVLCQASKVMNSPINTSTSVVLESYASLGLERRLRHYERVAHVTGCWSRKTQNSLLIRHAHNPDSNKDLDFASVPETPPGFMLQLHHCSRPGKWQQRWITLLQDGQMVSSKKPASSFLEKDCQRLCHMAVCDIYVATNEEATASQDHRQSRSYRASPIKGLKPPKKYVLAVKAQNKPITKHEADNYVHFFCTENPDVASRFHDMVHAWRSWYMVKVKRQSQSVPSLDTRETEPAPQITPVEYTPTKSISYLKVSSGHKVKISRDDTPYTIGEIGDSPLIDMKRFDKPLEEYGKDWIKIQRHSGGSPMTPGTTDSGVSLTTPSTGELEGNETFECVSPSEGRRKRLDTKKSSGPSGTVVTTEGSSDVPISITKPPTERSSTPPPEPKPEVSPWLPSASEHTAKLKAEQARIPPPAPPRPATSSGLTGRTSLQPPTESRRRRPTHRTHPSLPPQQVALWREATKWADSRASQNPESSASAPSAGQRLMAHRPSMPSLSPSPAATKRGAPANYPPIWREPATRPSTSGGERASRLARGRSTSGSSVRRGQGGEMPPPMPNMPAHWRQGARDVNARAAAGLSAPNLLNGGRGWAAK